MHMNPTELPPPISSTIEGGQGQPHRGQSQRRASLAQPFCAMAMSMSSADFINDVTAK
jgi:hypothetical protein